MENRTVIYSGWHCKRTILLYQLRSMWMPNYFRVFTVDIIHNK
jgi:hypothetical protein